MAPPCLCVAANAQGGSVRDRGEGSGVSCSRTSSLLASPRAHPVGQGDRLLVPDDSSLGGQNAKGEDGPRGRGDTGKKEPGGNTLPNLGRPEGNPLCLFSAPNNLFVASAMDPHSRIRLKPGVRDGMEVYHSPRTLYEFQVCVLVT
ncbi:hypothetical protein HJG60_012296 [Phyllostomus discolor]|uniref:Uncharacterized protein n=1 Tax=Phyllostomus discolor TaxID=89673 RepID=A0A833Z854_9CHIR|nr:hypothetical protein HJG60_012296 [Phyllostomus discolor]